MSLFLGSALALVKRDIEQGIEGLEVRTRELWECCWMTSSVGGWQYPCELQRGLGKEAAQS